MPDKSAPFDWSSPPVLAAFIALGGIALGLIIRDVVMAILLHNDKLRRERNEQEEERARGRRDLVRGYADPLYESVRSFRVRLDEIIHKGQARYLLSSAPKVPYLEYKWISTLYRLGRLLGWIRAFRRERSYLDPDQRKLAASDDEAIAAVEKALADGQDVEQLRLRELFKLWHLKEVEEESERENLGVRIDGVRQDVLGDDLRPRDLTHEQKVALAERCAQEIGSAKLQVPIEMVHETAARVCVLLGITEAYIYRDWQAAIGDLMITEKSASTRRYEVIGYGAFETRYLLAQASEIETEDRRWIDRIAALFLDLDVSKGGIFDARRDQIKNLHDGCLLLESHLHAKLRDLERV